MTHFFQKRNNVWMSGNVALARTPVSWPRPIKTIEFGLAAPRNYYSFDKHHVSGLEGMYLELGVQATEFHPAPLG